MSELGNMLFMVIAVVVAILGLFLFAKSPDGMQLAGFVLFLFGVVFVFGQIRRLTPWS